MAAEVDPTALRGLPPDERLGLADTHTGDWALVDAELAAWMRENGTGTARFAS